MSKTKSEEKPEEAIGSKADATLGRPESSKTAFFITPLGSDNSDIRRATNGLIEAVIRPVLNDFDIRLIPPHEILEPGNITRQIVTQILNADLVIANLTGLNANVMYELAVRHATRKPVISICDRLTKLPFDIAAERTIFFDNDMAGSVQLKDDLKKTIPKALEDKEPDNPIYTGIQQSIIQEITVKDSNPVETFTIEKLGLLDEIISMLRRMLPAQNSQSSASFYNGSPKVALIQYSVHPTLNEGVDRAVALQDIALRLSMRLTPMEDIMIAGEGEGQQIYFKSSRQFTVKQLSNALLIRE